MAHLADRNAKLIGLMRKVHRMVGSMQLRHRMTLYNQLYLSTMLYCSDVWGDSLKQHQKDKLHTLQRNAILSITGAYPSTNNSKLLDLLGLLEINDEIEFRSQTTHMDSLERRQKRAELIAEHVHQEPYGTSFRCRLGESIGREVFCFLTGHGPFVSHSRRFDHHLPENCRFCGLFVETADHLLLHCAAFGRFTIDQDTETSAIESRCKLILSEIRKL